MRARPTSLAAIALATALATGAALAQAPGPQPQTPLEWAKVAAKGVLDLCREDAPDAAAVADHGEVWGWPRFVPYLEHPEGYKREAGGQSRRTYTLGDTTAEVEVTVQSGEVTSAAPAKIGYFRCDVAANQSVGPDLETYFTNLYGAPTAKSYAGLVWLTGSARGANASGDKAALAAVVAAGAGASGQRIVLFHELDREQARITAFRSLPAG